MKKPTADEAESGSPDPVAQNVARLKELFPELVTEGPDGAAVDLEVLRQLVGDRTLGDAQERYGLHWHGKRRARQLALTRSSGTLRPCPGESLDWDTTRNLIVEGDNLEVLKLLQKSYAGKVKLVYIDPPYNTGKDFVYPDDFRDGIRNYLELTGQLEGGNRISSHTEASGRFHTDWLSMMAPRLVLARSLMTDDGALFVSIDDTEVANLEKLGCEVFGEENFVGRVVVVVNPRGRHLDRFLARTHDYLLVFVKNAGNPGGLRRIPKRGAMLAAYARQDERGRYREIGLRNRNQAFNPHTRPNLFYPLYVDPQSGRVALEPDGTFSREVLPETADGVRTCWTWSREKVAREGDLLSARELADGSWRVFRRDYLEGDTGEAATTLMRSLWPDKEFNNDYGRRSLVELFGEPVLDFPKSPQLLERIVEIGSDPGGIVLDFFAGSGTTGHAVLARNAADAGSRRYILVQLPEPLDPAKKAQRIAAGFCDKLGRPRNLAELTKERLRRAAQKIRKDGPTPAGDLGFRVFKLDSSNVRAWQPDRADLETALSDAVEPVEDARSEADVLYELILELGLDLCAPIETRPLAGVDVHAVAGGRLIACLAERIDGDGVEALAQGIGDWRRELDPAGDTSCVFRDGAFVDDAARTLLAASLAQQGIPRLRTL